VSQFGGKRRHIIVPDAQIRPGVPTDHVDWIADYIAAKKPDVVVCLGDWWDLASLNSHSEKGSVPLEGTRYKDDIYVGNEAFARLSAPMDAEMARTKANKKKAWTPRKVFLKGNHEIRADRIINNDPKYQGVLSSDDCLTPGWERHEFLKVVEIDGVLYSHYFKMQNSNNPIGGSTDNRLNKIGASHVQGHQVGFLYGNRVYPDGKTRHSLTCGSAYVHSEDYRGPQCNKHFRGIVVLQEVHDGDFLVMPVSLDFLCRKATGLSLQQYHVAKFPNGDWSNL
jgi:hypothetical protein